jgi:hypothetical protein
VVVVVKLSVEQLEFPLTRVLPVVEGLIRLLMMVELVYVVVGVEVVLLTGLALVELDLLPWVGLEEEEEEPWIRLLVMKATPVVELEEGMALLELVGYRLMPAVLMAPMEGRINQALVETLVALVGTDLEAVEEEAVPMEMPI